MLQGTRQQLALEVCKCAERLGLAVFLVGGIVRDALRGALLHDCDLDFVVEGDAQQLAREMHVQLGGTLKTFDAFFTAKIAELTVGTELLELDFASTRTEAYAHPGALPQVTRAASLRADLERRDFTINALALPVRAATRGVSPAELQTQVVDLFSGLSDLQQGIIRVLHARSFLDDPTRILRGARYVARLKAGFSPETEQLARAAVEAHAFESISWQRYYRELKFIFAEHSSLEAIELLQQLGAFGRVPELQHLEWRDFGAYLAAVRVQLGQEFPTLAYHLFLSLSYGLRLRQLGDSEAVEREFKQRGVTRKELQVTRLPQGPLSAEQLAALGRVQRLAWGFWRGEG
jgi:tRNA nucleotidyltransferase/poly(A) polymerase